HRSTRGDRLYRCFSSVGRLRLAHWRATCRERRFPLIRKHLFSRSPQLPAAGNAWLASRAADRIWKIVPFPSRFAFGRNLSSSNELSGRQAEAIVDWHRLFDAPARKI